MTLWRWSLKEDDWVYETETTNAELKRTIMRNCKRRNPAGTKFRWADDKPRRRRGSGRKKL